MNRGDRVKHKSKQHLYKGIGEVGFMSGRGLVFVKWPNAEIHTYPAYYKPSSLELVEGEQEK